MLQHSHSPLLQHSHHRFTNNHGVEASPLEIWETGDRAADGQVHAQRFLQVGLALALKVEHILSDFLIVESARKIFKISDFFSITKEFHHVHKVKHLVELSSKTAVDIAQGCPSASQQHEWESPSFRCS